MPGLHLWTLHIPGEHSGLSRPRGLRVHLCTLQRTRVPLTVACLWFICALSASPSCLPFSTSCLMALRKSDFPRSHELQDGIARNIPTWHSLWLTFAGEPLCVS